MRTLSLAAFTVSLVFWVACIAECPAEKSPQPLAGTESREQVLDDWRRTVDGWERSSQWEINRTYTRPIAWNMHPILVASFQLLASYGSLLAFSDDDVKHC